MKSSKRKPVAGKPVHPGIILKMELDSRNISQASFARHVKVKPEYLNTIIKARRGISAEMAVRLDRALGISADMWLRLQSQYELSVVDNMKFNDIEKIAA